MLNQPEYIVVDSISSVDPNALSLNQLSQKFIDKQGNRFALRFNRNTRRMEFVRITLESPNEAQKHKHVSHSTRQNVKPVAPPLVQKVPSLQEIIAKTPEQSSVKIPKPNPDSTQTINEVAVPKNVPQKTTQDRKPQESSVLDLGKMDLNILDGPTASPKQDLGDAFLKMEYDSAPSFIEIDAIEKRISEIAKIKDRIQSVLNNLQNSKIFEITGDPSENKNIIGNLNREFDLEFFQKLDQILNYHKELTTYPRSVNYYTAKYESSRKQILQSKNTDSEKLKLVTLWEMQELILGLVQKLKKMVLNALNILNMKNDNHIKQLPYNQQQMFRDSRTALLYCSEDISSLLISLERWVDTV
ncbi:LIC_10450 family protein [Leptospira santarosai]|uniref:Uncharacterized protein n=2 Tax=Leptospira santarosai TaxID=28183 RepID=A0A0E2BDT4_9LEPT|nr:hypothetical protein [Leptospira santarosai]EKO33523.1 hypothetical protein LEP1GSC179_1933 [Leptospira santarosai str. MOR084]EMJ46070.1 hypothetical protein LEP1GSC169_0135 [Leptospira santarosai str. HAI1349]EMM76750.1 hypothetical protein LEP1GSC040_1045 [Leptospira santarosai str. 2000030832]EMN22490.1 hypothetical protein LEP1GSC063_4147 [Leptospira santarosai serovar Arenal str. MAVJ 401]EMO23252.1 hypothetical protein LEP1GSC168_1208 [Leptospira santarosai str. HAI134]